MTTKVTRDVFDGVTRPIENIDINGGTLDGTPIGTNDPDVGFFTNLQTVNLTVTGSANFSGATVSGLTAYYADLAELYEADDFYEAGTVVSLGGKYEITKTIFNSTDVFGVISTKPAFLMNQYGSDEHANMTSKIMLPVALVGRVPCWVVGPIRKGERLVGWENGTARAAQAGYEWNSVIGRALADDPRTEKRLVEIAINTCK